MRKIYYIPDPTELVKSGEKVYLNKNVHFVIGDGLHLFDKIPRLAPPQSPNRAPFWHMYCTFCRNKGHLFSNCSYRRPDVFCTYCCAAGHCALECNLRLQCNQQLYERGYVSLPIHPADTHASALDLPAGYKAYPIGHRMHIDYRLVSEMPGPIAVAGPQGVQANALPEQPIAVVAEEEQEAIPEVAAMEVQEISVVENLMQLRDPDDVLFEE